MKRCKIKAEDNRGMTLIELLVCVAILSILIIIISNYMSSGARVYQKGHDEVDLQIELQMVVDHVSEQMLECESITAIGSETRYLFRKSLDKGLVFILDSANQTLYQRTIEVSASEVSLDGDISENYFQILKDHAEEDPVDMGCISTYVKSLRITKVGEASSRLYSVEVTVAKEEKEKTTTKQVTLRNAE